MFCLLVQLCTLSADLKMTTIIFKGVLVQRQNPPSAVPLSCGWPVRLTICVVKSAHRASKDLIVLGNNYIGFDLWLG